MNDGTRNELTPADACARYKRTTRAAYALGTIADELEGVRVALIHACGVASDIGDELAGRELEADARRLAAIVDELARLALVEAKLIEQCFGHFGFGQRHDYSRNCASSELRRSAATKATMRSASSSASVLLLS